MVRIGMGKVITSHLSKHLFHAMLPVLFALCAAVTPAQADTVSATPAAGTGPFFYLSAQ